MDEVVDEIFREVVLEFRLASIRVWGHYDLVQSLLVAAGGLL